MSNITIHISYIFCQTVPSLPTNLFPSLFRIKDSLCKMSLFMGIDFRFFIHIFPNDMIKIIIRQRLS